ncbi:MAG: Mur ligase domain-containing protein, partial [Holophagales bacterium]|nr:Mur ligase domain-containing protein [Holophagales bacterium]
MKLKDVIAGLETVEVVGDLSVDVSDVTYDSRRVEPGTLFVAMRGEVTDGHRYIDSAIEAGAAAIIAERIPEKEPAVPYVVVNNSRAALADVAGALYGHPDRELRLVGITGTNGKSSVAHLIHAIMRAADGKAGLIG